MSVARKQAGPAGLEHTVRDARWTSDGEHHAQLTLVIREAR